MAGEPKRRVKSIRKPGDKPKKKKVIVKCYSRVYLYKMIKKELKKRATINDSVPLIYNTYRKLMQIACELMARRYRKITVQMAHVALAKLIPHELAMNAIREFRREAAAEAGAPKKPMEYRRRQ